MAQPGAPPAAPAGGWDNENTNSQKKSDHADLTQANRPPRNPVRFRSGIGRVFYCFLVGRRVVVVHAFIKKTQQTPDKELKLARTRIKEIDHR